MLPGVKIEVLYDRRSLIHVTTDTVQENLLVGMVLVTAVLLMFLSNVRTALIVAINVPWRCCLPSPCCSCAESRPTCFRSALWTSASSSIRR